MIKTEQLPICIFLDRDGVLNELKPGAYIQSTNEFIFRDGVLEGLRKLSECCKYLFVVTNQQGIGKKIMTEHQLFEVHQYMLNEIERHGGRLNGIYHCPHLASELCDCRKPGTGMIDNIHKDFPDTTPSVQFLLGDSISDLELGNKIQAKTFGMRHGYNTYDDWSAYEVEEVNNFDAFTKRIISMASY
ncbi:MAG: HAD-IIIA family hydrolase [Saprospiraceae bacterium]|nr:HAD-IIIA family hydrolase [Saprospiraceae bacterium]